MKRDLPPDRVPGSVRGMQGLTTAQVDQQRAIYGENQVVSISSGGWARLIRETAQDPMLWFLLLTATIYSVIGQTIEAIVLGLAVIPIVGMDAYLHRRTQRSTAALRAGLASHATVIRDGVRQEIPTTALVPADVVVLSANDLIPADGLVVDAKDLQIDESALTGESWPVRKQPWPQDSSIENRAVDVVHWAFAGTRALAGQAMMRVIYTGRDTYYGEIVLSVEQTEHELTPMQLAVAKLTRVLLYIAGAICIALALVRLWQGHGLIDALVSALTLAVAALPEEFPVVFAFFLGMGVYRLAKKRALVRKAVVVENIGRVTCICTDKTGTLTLGRLTLDQTKAAAGVGADRLLQVAGMASRRQSHDPMDAAIFEAAGEIAQQAIATFPFTEDRRREVAVYKESDAILVCAKGAPETIFAMTVLSATDLTDWQDQTAALARSGHKVIAVCDKAISSSAWDGNEPAGDFRFLGLLAFIDPVREGVHETVRKVQQAGIRVIMVTGDHPNTSQAIARAVGLGQGQGQEPRVLEGTALMELLGKADEVDKADRAVVQSIADYEVIARALPAHKQALVKALKQAGHVVAVTGDGVNDAPALKAADVGIAMSERGSAAARDAAPILLMDDNFKTIVDAISEGQQLFSNLRLSFAYLLMVHIPLVLTAALIPFAGLPLVYLPIHIVWLELIIHPTALLAFQQTGTAGLGRVGGAQPAAAFFDQRQWITIVVTGLVLSLAVVLGYVYSLGQTHEVEHARAMAICLLVTTSVSITLGLTWRRWSAVTGWLAVATGLTLAVTVIPSVASFLQLAPLHGTDWFSVVAVSLLIGVLASQFQGHSTPSH